MQQPSFMKFMLGMFLCFSGAYILTSSGHIYTIDSYQYFAMTRSLVEHKSLVIPKVYMCVEGKDGQCYSKLGKGQSVFAIPFYLMGKLARRIVPDSIIKQMDEAQAKVNSCGVIPEYRSPPYQKEPPDPLDSFFTLLFNPIVSALSLCLLFLLVCHIGYGYCIAFAVTFIAGFATYLWPYSRDFFTHPLELLLLLCTLIARLSLETRFHYSYFFIMGLCGGIALHVRIPTVVWIPVFGFSLIHVFLKHKARTFSICRALFFYLFPLMASGLGLCLLNYCIFGDFFTTGYHTSYDQGFTTPLLRGLYTNLFKPHRSIFVFAPPLIIALLNFPSFFKKNRTLTLLITTLFMCYLFMYSKWWATTGGWCIGPRFLLPVVILLLLPLAEVFMKKGGGKNDMAHYPCIDFFDRNISSAYMDEY